MSLFKWSTPERRRGDQHLPVIPNEIYFSIFEHIASPAERPTPEQLETFTNLSCVCRFFANCCLPRIFEFLEFSGDVFRDRYGNDRTCRATRASTLCTQIAAEQPLALALAKMVRVCHFTGWRLDDAGAWLAQFVNKYTASLLHMKNIRELVFHACLIDAEYWDAIVPLESLEELVFHDCRFLPGVTDMERAKVSRLQVINCHGIHNLLAAVDARYLCTLTVDFMSFRQFDAVLGPALKELRLSFHRTRLIQQWFASMLHDVLVKVPHSLESLWLLVGSGLPEAGFMFHALFADPAWKALSARSLILRVLSKEKSDARTYVLSSPWKDVGVLTHEQSSKLLHCPASQDIPLNEVRCVLQDDVGSSSSLEHVDIYGYVFHLVDGTWSEEPCTTL